MNFEEYRTAKFEQYRRFSEVIAKIFDVILATNKFKVQQIQFREKSTNSLHEKLKSRKLLDSNDIENQIKDLAGCRIIFYYNSDIDRFAASDLVRDNFKIVPNSYKKNYAKENPESANDYYIADHFQVELNEARLALPEYQEFTNFRCEVQITNTLFHAYAETNHDIIYKKPDTDKFGERIFKDLNDQLIEVMEKHLKPASHKIDKIHTTFTRFNEGKQLFDSDIMSDIQKTQDRNSLYEILEKYKDLVLPNINFIGDDISELVKIIEISLEKSKGFGDIDIETPYGSLPGYTHNKVIQLLSDILQYVNYINPKIVLAVNIKLYDDASDSSTKKIIIEKIKELSRYRTRILSKIGLFVQNSLIETLESFDDTTLLNLRDVAIAILHETISMRLTEYEFKGKEVIVNSANLVGSDKIELIRNKSIDILKKLYKLSKNSESRSDLLGELSHACSFPNNLHDNPTLLRIIARSTISITEFLIDEIDFSDMDLLITSEHNLFGLYRVICSYRDHYSNQEDIHKELCSARDALFKWAETVNTNTEYRIYKTLISYDPIFMVEWNDEDYLFQEKSTYREGLIAQLVDNIEPQNYPDWISRLSQISKTKLTDGATFFSFQFFIKLVSNKQPNLLLMAAKKPDEMSRIISYLLQGIYSSSLKNESITMINSFAAEGRFLPECLHVFVATETFDENIVKSLLESSIKNNDTYAVSYAVLAAFRCNDSNSLEVIVIPALEYLTSIKNTSWIKQSYGFKNLDLVFSKANASLVHSILHNLLYSSKVSHEEEFLLNSMLGLFLELIIEHFKNRVEYSLSPECNKDYQPIPFDLHFMQGKISSSMTAFELLLQWPATLNRAASNLISLFYPSYNDAINQKLTSLLKESIDNVDKILSALSFYQGDVQMYGLCEQIILSIPDDSPILITVKSIMLGESGIISGSGTYGLAEHYQARRPYFVAMAESENNKIKMFANDALRDIDNSIAIHRKRGDSDEMHFSE